jgi:hypothetical protein
VGIVTAFAFALFFAETWNQVVLRGVDHLGYFLVTAIGYQFQGTNFVLAFTGSTSIGGRRRPGNN